MSDSPTDSKETQAKHKQQSAPSKKKRLLRIVALLLLTVIALALIFVGPWPNSHKPFENENYFLQSKRAIETSTPFVENAGTLEIGYAEIEITPKLGQPIAGFTSREPKETGRVSKPCFARALTLKRGDTAITILSADLLEMHGQITKDLYDKTKLMSHELYFTASHTHAGPGGWSQGYFEEMTYGKFTQTYYDELLKQLIHVVLASRTRFTPVSFASAQFSVKEVAFNRIDASLPVYDYLNLLAFRQLGVSKDAPPLLTFITYNAHPAIIGHNENYGSPDYPGTLVNILKEKVQIPHVHYAAGAVGDLNLIKPEIKTEPRLQRTGNLLANAIIEALPKLEYKDKVSLKSLRAQIDMPPVRFTLSENWRLSPVLSNNLTEEHTFVHALQLNDTVLIGMPGDYAGHLTFPLHEKLKEQNLQLVLTSFNGDYKGYFVDQQVYTNYPGYETRTMSFYDKYTGEYLNAIALKCIHKLKYSSK